MTNAKDKEGNLLPDADILTKYGEFLRNTSLDELPELINILKALVVLSSTAFDTYLLHAHPLVFDNLFKSGFTWIAGLPTAAIPFTVIGCAALIYLAAFVVARIRIFLYDKLKVKKLLQLIAKPIDKLIYPASMD